jgi:hypothetical protein
MRAKEIKIYKFSELPDDAKDKAIEWYASASCHDEWWQNTYEDAESVGIKIKGFDCDRGNKIDGAIINCSARECAEAIKKSHGDTCETYKLADAFLIARDKIVDEAPRDENGDFESEYDLDAALDEIEAEFERAILEEYLSILRREYDFVTSREYIIDAIEANEYEFTEEGKIA